MTRPRQAFSSTLCASLTLALLLSLVLAHAEVNPPEAQQLQPQCQTSPTVVEACCHPRDQRYSIERQRIFHDIDHRHGKWNTKHPRWAILQALHGFDRYREIAGAEIDRFEGLYGYVSTGHRKILDAPVRYGENFDRARAFMDVNTILTDAIVENGLAYYDVPRQELDDFAKDFESPDRKDKDSTLRKLRTHASHALKHMVRDWSIAGHDERDATFPYILSAISEHFSLASQEEYKVLVPGAGLGRLAHEISLLDSERMMVTTNEKDEFMNLAYRYISSSPGHRHVLHPFLESWSHARTRDDIYRGIPITTPHPLGSALLVPGDFTTLPFSPPYNAIATLFFIDTARDLVAYLEKIHELLEPHGIWINVGPLLYGSAPYVQLTLEEIILVAERVGFVIERREEKDVRYNFNGSALYRNGYIAQCWVARKKEKERGRWTW